MNLTILKTLLIKLTRKLLDDCLETNKYIDDDRGNKKTAPSQQPCKNLQGKQIHISGLDTSH